MAVQLVRGKTISRFAVTLASFGLVAYGLWLNRRGRPAAPARRLPAAVPFQDNDPARHGVPDQAGGTAQARAPAEPSQTTEPDQAEPDQAERGRTATQPQDIPARGWRDVAWRVWAEIGNDRVLAVAGGVAFYTLLAVFPAIAALVSLYGLIADAATINDHISGLAAVLPAGTHDIIAEQVQRLSAQRNASLSLGAIAGVLVSLWSANAGMKAIFDALNVVYDETEKRGFIMLTVQSLAFTLGAILVLVVALASIVVVPVVLAWLGLEGLYERLLAAARWPILLVAVMLALAILYRYGPSRQQAQWRWITPGSAFAAITWLAVSLAFSWYVANFANYNATYGSLGAVVALMVWIWISSAVVLVGAEINAEMEHQTAQDSTTAPPKPLGQRGAQMADTVGKSAA